MKKIIHYLILWLLSLMILFLIVTLCKPDILLPIIDWIKVQIENLWKWNYLLAFISALAESLPIIWAIIPGQVIMLSVGWFYGGTWITQFFWDLAFAILWSVISIVICYFLLNYYCDVFFISYCVWDCFE